MERSGVGYIGWLIADRSADVHENFVLVQPIRTLQVLRTASPSRVAVDETAVKINGEWSCVHAAIELDSRLILDVALFDRHGTDPAAVFLQKLHEKHNLSDAEFLVD